MSKYTWMFLISVFISSVSQVLLKRSAKKEYQSIVQEYINRDVIFAYFLFFLATITTVFAYTFIPFSMGIALESLGYVFVSIFSYCFLKEKMSRNQIIGLLIIVLGVLIFSI